MKNTAEDLRKLMHSHIQEECLLTSSDFTLSGGASSSYYFDCKKATLDGQFLLYFAEYVCEHVIPQLDQAPDLVGGLTLGADFITAAIVMHSASIGGNIKQGSIVRKEAKKHGTKSKIENEVTDAEAATKRILVVEDVITSGSSVAKACDEFINYGYQPVAIVTIVDRDAGGMEMLEAKYGLKPHKIFAASDFKLA